MAISQVKTLLVDGCHDANGCVVGEPSNLLDLVDQGDRIASICGRKTGRLQGSKTGDDLLDRFSSFLVRYT